jgi:hypothetical protein
MKIDLNSMTADEFAGKLKADSAHILECAEVYENIQVARKKLLGKELTSELFDELNGEDRGLDTILGRTVIPNQDPAQNRQLKSDILAALENNLTSTVTEMTAALECYCQDLVETVSNYDAYAEEQDAARTKIVDILKELSDDDKTKFFETRLEFNLMQCNNIKACFEVIGKYIEFLSSDQVNLGILKDIAKKNSGDMTDEDKQFLKELREAYESGQNAGTFSSRPFWTAQDDSFMNSTLTACGYEPKTLSEVVKDTGKVQKKFVSTVRKFKEALCRDCDTEQEVMSKNSDFWDAVGCVIGFTWSVNRFFTRLNQMIQLISKEIESVKASATPPENTDDNPTPNPDENTPPDNQGGNQPANTDDGGAAQ